MNGITLSRGRVVLPVFVLTATLLVGSGCVVRPSLLYTGGRHLTPFVEAVPGKLLVLRPLDDRYVAEREGESMAARWVFGSPAGLFLARYRGNRVTSDGDFFPRPTLFGGDSPTDAVGQGLLYALRRSNLVSKVGVDRGPVKWRRRGGTTDVPLSVVGSISRKHGAGLVLAVRVKHLYGMKFGQKSTTVVVIRQRHGRIAVSHTFVHRRTSRSPSFGNCVLELQLYEVRGARVQQVYRTIVAGRAIGAKPPLAAAEAMNRAINLAVEKLARSLQSSLRDTPSRTPRRAPDRAR